MDKHSPLTHIIVHNAHEHNLKNINLNLPKNKLVVITGVSGSGKSTLAFDTIYAEGQRKYIESQHYPRKSTADKFCRWTLQDRSFSLLFANFANTKFKKTYFEYGIYGINYLNIPFCNVKI